MKYPVLLPRRNTIKFSNLLMSLVFTFSVGAAFANSFSKSCQDYNQSSVLLLDDMLPTDGGLTPEGQDIKKADYQGTAENGKPCEIKITRINREQCGISSKRYYVVINVDTNDTLQKSCAAELVMDVDLKNNSKTSLEYKNTYAYPQLFSTDFNKIKAQRDRTSTKFSCRSHVKDRPGYRVGHDRLNNCHIH